MIEFPPTIHRVVGEHPLPLLFATISGAHLYGFASPDSDFDIRGAHILPARDVLSLAARQDTIDSTKMIDGLEIDVVTHDVEKVFGLMLKPNGYVLEQLYSPLVVFTCPEHEELKLIGRGCVTRHHIHHYLGFSLNQWTLFAKEDPPRLKLLLYVYRVLLTGIHLMRTGEIEANLVTLANEYDEKWILPFVERKIHGREKEAIDSGDLAFHQGQVQRLEAQMRAEGETSSLPSEFTAKQELSDLLVRLRLRSLMNKKP